MTSINIRRGLLVFACILFAFNTSCESESVQRLELNDTSNSELIQDTETVRRPRLEYRKASLKEIPNINSFIDKNARNQGAIRKSNPHNIILDTTNILAVTDSLNRTNYTLSFIVHKEEYTTPTIYNLIFGVDSLGVTSNPIVLRYKSESGFEEEWVNNDFDLAYFTGEISLHKYTDFFEEDISLTGSDAVDAGCPPEFDQYGDPIACIVDEVSSSGSGGGSSGGGALAPAGGSSGGCTYTSYWNYCGGSNQSSSHSASICGGDGTGAGWVMEVDCPNYTTTTQFYKGSIEANKDSDCENCSSGPSGSTATNTYAKSVLKLEWHFLDKLDYQLKYSELTWLNINNDFAYKLNQFLLSEGYNQTNLEFVKFAMEIEMKAQDYRICNATHDCIASIHHMANGLRELHSANSDAILMADYLDSLIDDYDSFTPYDLEIFYNTAVNITNNFNNKYLSSILNGFAEGVKPIVEIALFEVGGSFAIQLLSKLPAIVKTAQIVEVINNLKKAANSLSVFKYAERFGIKTYAQHVSFFNSMGISRSQLGVQVHHLIEQRFATNSAISNWLGSNANNWKSIVLTKEEHAKFTSAWKKAIGYDKQATGWTTFNTNTATVEGVKKAAKSIYKDYPDILKALGL